MEVEMETETITVAGIDEVGYGCIFGPICCAAVVIHDKKKLLENIALHKKHVVLRDSKKMTEKQLQKTFDFLTTIGIENIENNCIDYEIGIKSAAYIDLHGLSKARMDAFHDSLEKLETRLLLKKITMDKILVDGNFFKPFKSIPHELIVKGDATVLEIMCASIIAKRYRDLLIYDLVDKHPELQLQEKYKLRDNVGYATKAHLEGIKTFGPILVDEINSHRTSYSFFQSYQVLKK